jgi:predicted 2-oxoglutarate/Fe(II)-dependent dioxygenase YbiX
MSDPTVTAGAEPSRSAPPEPLELGDYVPRIALPNPTTLRIVSLMNQTIAGGLIVLLCPAESTSLAPWAHAVEALNTLGGRLFVVTPTVVALPSPLEGLIDNVLVRPLFGLGGGGDGAIILDSGGRFAARLTGEGASPAAVLGECRRLHERTAPQLITTQAPVIVLPDVITPALRDRLLRYWQEGEKRAGTVARAGDRFSYDTSVKRREDVLITDDALMIELMRAVRWCVAPAMQRAFNFEVAQAEAFRIGCYPAGEGYFRRHRDNSNANTNHRLYAISINLNEDYVGGEVVFPEYGRMRYRPPACGAVIFSSSLLHEALDVTEGRRFATFSFFSDKAGAARVAERLARERSQHDIV